MRNSVTRLALAGFGQVLPGLMREFAGSASWPMRRPLKSPNSSTRAGAKFGKSVSAGAGRCGPHFGRKPRIGCHQIGVNMFGAGEVQAIVDRMCHLDRNPQGARNEKGGRYYRFKQARQPVDAFNSLLSGQLVAKDFLPKDVCRFDEDEIRSLQLLAPVEQAARRQVLRLVHEPLYGNRSVDDQGHRSRSSRSRIVLSVWTIPLGVIAAIRSAISSRRRRRSAMSTASTSI